MLNEIKPYFKISLLNSVIFTKKTEWNSYNNQKTNENTLSYHEDGVNNKQFYHLFQFVDAIRIQFRSSYNNHVIKVIGCDESEKIIIPVQRTNNLNITDRRTAYSTSYDGYLTFYFGTGALWAASANTLPVIVGSYDLGVYVPEWLSAGKNIEVNNVLYEITEIVWIEEQGLYGVKTSTLFSSFPSDFMLTSVYNIEEFEIFEFDIDWYHFSKGNYQIELLAEHNSFENLTYISERIKLQAYHENTHLVISENKSNNDINYLWGIQHLSRVPYESSLTYSPSGENEIHKTDDNVYQIASNIYNNYEARFSKMPINQVKRLTKLFSLSSILLDSKQYLTEGIPEVERLDDSNLYVMTIKLIEVTNIDFVLRTSEYSTVAIYNNPLLVSQNSYLLIAGGLLNIN